MTAGAVVFMMVSWTLVLGLTAWSFGRILRQKPTSGAGLSGPDGAAPNDSARSRS